MHRIFVLKNSLPLAFESAIAAFSDQFEATNPTQETPDAEFSETDSNIVDADTTLPEEDISGA